jgi:hypothetical protein
MPNYVTQCYDNLRTGWNPNETILIPDSVWQHYGGPTYLGPLFAYQVQGQVYAQPLYVENVPFAGGSKDAVFVATEENWVYAFDARSAQQMWARQLIPAGEQLVTPSDIAGCANVQPYIGITSTPVIDPASMTLYVVAKTRSTTDPALFYHRLYAIALDTGQDRLHYSNVIQPTVTYPQATISFDPQWQLQRPALLLMNGLIYIGFGAHCDIHPPPYHGWVVAHDAATLNPVSAFPSTETNGAGIWQAGRGLAGDAQGWVYCMTGNGPASGLDYGDMVLKLTPRAVQANLIEVADYFCPCDWQFLNANDVDLGSGGPLLLPDQPGPYPHLLVAAGKEGTVYLLNRDRLGYRTFPPAGWQYPQECANPAISTLWYVLGTSPLLPPGSRDALFGGPAYYAPAGADPRIYYCGQDDVVKAFYYDPAQGRLIGPFDKGNWNVPNGAIPVVSSNGGTVGTGILWVLSRGNPRVLTAYDLNPNRSLSSYLLCDIIVGAWTGSLGPPATVVNGRVYAACDNQVVVYGLVPAHWMAVNAILLQKSGIQRTIQVTVTDHATNAPIAGATVEVFDSNTGALKASGSTGGNGQVRLTYSRCTQTSNGPPITEDYCPAKASKPGYMDEDFLTPIN